MEKERGETILVVNDTPDELNLIACLLGQAGYEVSTATDGLEGFEAVRQIKPALIISDVSMPRADGIELCRLLRRDPELSLTPLLLVSALRKDTAAVVEGLQAGADDYLESPYDPMRLIARAARLIERARAEKSLRKSEERFRALIENSSDIINILDVNGNIIYENPSKERQLGYAADEIVGQNAFDFVHPDDLLQVFQTYAFVGANPGVAAPVEYRFRHLDGRWKCFEALAKNLLDNPHVSGIVVNSRDITARREAERSLAESEQRYRSLFEHHPDAVYSLDLEGHFVSANAATYALAGWETGEIIGQSFEPFVGAEDRDRVMEHFLKAREGEPQNYDLPFVSKDGRLIELNITNLPIIVDGKIEGIYGIAKDVTERKRAERERLEIEERYRRLVEISPNAIIVHSGGRVAFVNGAGVRLLGASTAGELLGRRIMNFVHPDDRESVEKPIEMLDMEATSAPLERKKLVRLDGTIIDVEAAAIPFSYRGGGAVQLVARDITDRKQAEEALRLSEEQLRQSQKMEAIGQLAGGIAHDFNNLLTAITGYTDLSLKRVGDNTTVRRNLEEVRRAADRAASLTRQLLAFSRKQVLQPKALGLNEVVTDMDQMLRRLIGEDIELQAVLDLHLGHVKADPGQLQQVILNLAVNARDAMPGGGRLVIGTTNAVLDDADARRYPYVQPGAYVVLAVTDTGSGMDAQTREHIFEPFFTTKEIGKGTGLGLSTVYGIVKQSGGYVWVDSEVGRGSTFRIYLPRIEKMEEEETVEPHAEPSRGYETVLLVEDEKVVRSMTREILETQGYKVLEARHGVEAVQICERHTGALDLVLTDVVMPLMSGRELVERLIVSRPEMRVLYMSGYTDDAIVHHGIVNKGIAFIEKPFTPASLSRKVREALDSGHREF